jgi:hypothetical protein
MSTTFNWYDRKEFASIPKNELLKLTAKTTTPTDHSKDKTLPVEERKIRIYPAEELMMAARSLIQRPVLINHNGSQSIGWVLDAEYNPSVESVECIVQVQHHYVEAYNQNKFSTCSVGVNARSEDVVGDTVTYHGIWFDEVSLVITDGTFKAGDPNATIQAFETKMEFIGAVESVPIHVIEKVVQRGDKWCVIHCHGDLAGQAIKCFSGPDAKDQAMAMHYAIQAHKKKETVEIPKSPETPQSNQEPKPVEPVKSVETPKEPIKPIETPKPVETPKLPEAHNPSIVPQKPVVQEPKKEPTDEIVSDAEIEEFVKKIHEYPNLVKKVTDLETTVNTAQTVIKELKGKQDEEIKKAVSAEKERIVNEIEKVIPSILVTRQGSVPFNRLVIDVKRKLLELKKNE